MSSQRIMPMIATSFCDMRSDPSSGIQLSPSSLRTPNSKQDSMSPSSPAGASDISNLTDTLLAERYQFIAEVGFGNWGSVWKCRPRLENEESLIAVKLVHRTSNSASSARVKSLWGEYKTVRALQSRGPHPGIVLFESFIITPGYALISMPLYDRLIPVELGEATARGYFKQLISAVQFLHDNGCSHNDIKPANILLTTEDTPVLVDFGFALRFAPRSAAPFIDSHSWGTPEYSAPQVIQGIPHDTRLSDIFSLGVTFYEIVVGRTPFETTSVEEFLTRESLEVYYERTRGDKFYGEVTISAALADLVRRMIDPSVTQRLQRAEHALQHPFFSPVVSSVPSRPLSSVPELGTPLRKLKRSPKDAKSKATPIKIFEDPVIKEGSIGDERHLESLGVIDERHPNTPTKSISNPSRIPILKSRISSPMAIPTSGRSASHKQVTPPTIAASRPHTSPSPFLLDRAPARAPPAFKSTLSSSLGRVGSPKPIKKARAPKGDEIETLSVNATAPQSLKRSPSSLFFRRISQTMSLSGSKLSSGSALDTTGELSQMSIRAVATATVASPRRAAPPRPAPRESVRDRLDSLSRQIQQIIELKPRVDFPTLKFKRSAPELANFAAPGPMSTSEVQEYTRQLRAELAATPRRKPVVADPTSLPFRPGSSLSMSRIASRPVNAGNERPVTRIRPSLSPSFISSNSRVDGAHNDLTAAESVPSLDNARYRKGHRRIPTAIRHVPAILLSESADEYDPDDSDASIRAPSPAPEPRIYSEARVLPTFVDVDTSSSSEEDVVAEEEATMTYAQVKRISHRIARVPPMLAEGSAKKKVGGKWKAAFKKLIR